MPNRRAIAAVQSALAKPPGKMVLDDDAIDQSYPLTAVGVLSFAVTLSVNNNDWDALDRHLKALSRGPGSYRW